MTYLKQIHVRLEISFWNLAIILLSRSALFQSLVPWFYSHITQPWTRLRCGFKPAHAALWAAAGLCLGFLVGFLRAV